MSKKRYGGVSWRALVASQQNKGTFVQLQSLDGGEPLLLRMTNVADFQPRRGVFLAWGRKLSDNQEVCLLGDCGSSADNPTTFELL